MTQRKNSAFTLIEMLVVIGVIAILATLITGVGIRAAEKKKYSRVDAEKHRLVTAIEAYQHELGTFPPDNGNNVKDGPQDERASAGTNQLYYELTGPTYVNDPINPSYTAFDSS